MGSEGTAFQVGEKGQCILGLQLVDERGWSVSDDGRGWGQILKAVLEHAKRCDLFSVGHHYRMLSGLMTGSVLLFSER